MLHRIPWKKHEDSLAAMLIGKEFSEGRQFECYCNIQLHISYLYYFKYKMLSHVSYQILTNVNCHISDIKIKYHWVSNISIKYLENIQAKCNAELWRTIDKENFGCKFISVLGYQPILCLAQNLLLFWSNPMHVPLE